MGLTLNQVIQRLESLAGSHRQINTVHTGSVDTFLANDRIYPCCFIEQQPGFSISGAEKQTFYTFKIHFFDLMDVAANSLENEREVHSDMALIAEDYMAMLTFNDYLTGEYGWSVSDATGQVSSWKLQDIAAGVAIEVQIGVRYNADRCRVPAVGIVFETDKGMKMIQNYIHTVTAEAEEITIPALANKEILQVHIGDKLGVPGPSPGSSVLDVNQYTYDVSSGAFSFGTFLQPGQVLQILNRGIL